MASGVSRFVEQDVHQIRFAAAADGERCGEVELGPWIVALAVLEGYVRAAQTAFPDATQFQHRDVSERALCGKRDPVATGADAGCRMLDARRGAGCSMRYLLIRDS